MDSICFFDHSAGMAKDEDDNDEGAAKRDRLTLNPRPATIRYLKQLVALGIYGSSPTTAANRLVDEGIRLAIKDGLIDKERDL